MMARGKEMVWRIFQLMVSLATMLMALLVSVLHPLKQLVYVHHPNTPPPSLPAPHNFPDCFSDDEVDCTVSSDGSSLAAPLHSSSSSDPSDHQFNTPHSNYFSPSSPTSLSIFSQSPLKHTMTSVGSRSKGRFSARTPGGRVSRLFCEGGRVDIEKDSPVLTPRMKKVQGKDDYDSDAELVTMKPQSLAATFDYFSDND